jgi:HEAT repeat protein
VPALIEALKDKSINVRQNAAFALGGIGPAAKDAVPALSEALKDHEAIVSSAAEGALKSISK